MKLGVCNEIFKERSIEMAARAAREIGYEGVEIALYTICKSPKDLDEGDRAGIKKMFFDLGLEAIGVHWIYASPPGLKLFSPDKEVRDRTFKHTLDCIELTYDIGGRIVVLGSPSQRTIPDGFPIQEAYKWALEVFKKCGDYAYELGVFLVIEPLPRRDTNFINNVDEALRLVEEVRSEGFKLMIDTMHAEIEEGSVKGAIYKAKNHLTHIHTSDPSKAPTMNFKEVIEALRQAGYNKYVSLEHVNPELKPYTAAEIGFNHLKQILNSFELKEN